MVETAFARGSQRALSFHGIWYDWEWMRQAAARIEALLDAAGVGPDLVIAIAPANRPSCAAALLGILARKREAVMIYAYQSPEAIARKIGELGCAAVIAPAESWAEPTMAAAIAAGAVGISLSEESQEIVPGTCLDRARDHRKVGPVPGLHLLTSGTTGPPKLRHLDYDFLQRAMVLESPMQAYGMPAPPTPALHVAAFGNIAGLYCWLPLVVAGRPSIMTEKFDFAEWVEYVREWKPESTGMPPSAYRTLMESDLPVETLNGIKYMSAGASALDADLQTAVEQKYGVKILHAYGATEFGGIVSAVMPEHIEKFGPEKSFSIGRPLAGSAFRIVDPESGEVLPAGQTGLLHLKVPRLGQEWVPTSDLAWLDEDGFLYYAGRSDGAIVRGGFKIDPEAVRSALLEHEAIFDAIVAGAPDARLGEVPVAVYVVRSGFPAPGEDELKAHLRARLPATFLPTGYRALEVLPLTPTNKPDLAAVRAMFSAGPG